MSQTQPYDNHLEPLERNFEQLSNAETARVLDTSESAAIPGVCFAIDPIA